MKPTHDHLTLEEIAALIEPEEGTAVPADRRSHAQTCSDCSRMVRLHREADELLHSFRRGPRDPSRIDCPKDDEWASMAAGFVDPRRRDELMEHASTCDACGALLRDIVECFSRELSSEETAELANLKTSTVEGQRDLAGMLAHSSHKRPVIEWMARAAAVVVALVGGWWAYSLWSERQPELLMAQAYSQQRPFEFRIPGGDRGPVRLEKGGSSSCRRPPALLEAEARIARELEKNPERAKWLDLRARAEMLAWNPETAIATLTRANDLRPETPELLADLGLAYALRAESAGRAVDYGTAIEYLSRSLKAKPDVAQVVFNRAIVYERMFLYEQAIEEWKRYLLLDPQGAWSEEARTRLAALEQKKKPGTTP